MCISSLLTPRALIFCQTDKRPVFCSHNLPCVALHLDHVSAKIAKDTLTHQEGATSGPQRACGKECLTEAKSSAQPPRAPHVAIHVHACLRAYLAPGSGKLSRLTTPRFLISNTIETESEALALREKRTRSKSPLSHRLPSLKQALPASIPWKNGWQSPVRLAGAEGPYPDSF